MRPTTRADCAALDREDALAPFRERFTLPEGVIYLDGNSLGPLPKATQTRLAQVIELEWGRDLIRSWNQHDWIGMAARIGDKIGRLIGAPPGSTLVGDSTSINVFKALGAALTLRPDRRVIVSERGNFPTDLYIAQGLAALLGHGHTLRLVDGDAIAEAIGADVAVVLLTQVDYRTGRLLDMDSITRAAHAAGALIIWDLAHSAGALPVSVFAADADFAVGCGYKYLNGGPGAPAFLYAAPRLQDGLRLPLTGWFGHEAPFAFEPGYRPADGIARAAVGTPPVLSLAALEVGVDLALEAPMDAVRAKSLRMSTVFAELIAERCADFDCVTPRQEACRGSQVSFAHPDGYAIMQALIASGVIGDFRAPDILRFGMTPLYLRYTDLWDAAAILADIVRSSSWQQEQFQIRSIVT